MNILLVDDDRESRSYLAELLRDVGHQVEECENGFEGLTIFTQGEFDLVITDNRMPRISGIELIREIRGIPEKRHTNAVILTGYGELETAIEALRLGATDYLLKPINIQELIGITERVASQRTAGIETQDKSTRVEEAVKAISGKGSSELRQLKQAYYLIAGLGGIGVFSESIKRVFEQARVLHYDRSIPILLEGETGTGKEVIARYVHYGEENSSEPFVALNCCALAPSMFESELFGYEPGAFTGGLPKGQKGKIDLARGGTLFLDEITEIPINLQAKLLRVIQEKEFYRVGGLKSVSADVRIICASNLDIQQKVLEGSFRKDLFYRLNVGRIFLPPLRERQEEIIPLAEMMLKEISRNKGKHYKRITPEAETTLVSYQWPGNIRELRNLLEYTVAMNDDIELKAEHLSSLQSNSSGFSPSPESLPGLDISKIQLPSDKFELDKMVDEIILKALQMHKGNKTKTANYLGMSRRALCYRLENMEPKSILNNRYN